MFWGQRVVGSNPASPTLVVSQDIGNSRTHGCGFGSFISGCRCGWSSGALVALCRVEDEVAEQFAGGGVDDADVEVLDEDDDDDAGSGVDSADADRVELRTGRAGSGARRRWWAGDLGRAATCSSSAGSAPPCRRWWGGWGWS
jgi:hypothetical protein